RCRPGDGPCEGAIISYGAEGAVPLQGAQERFKREATESLQHTQAPRGLCHSLTFIAMRAPPAA
ncbi:MAG: hypothetical protein ACXWJ2_06670, partial [Hyphomicrobium sp.]